MTISIITVINMSLIGKERIQHPNILLPKIFLILTIIFFMWIVIVISGPLVLGWSASWAGLSLSLWIFLISILIGLFIIIDIILYMRPLPLETQSIFQDASMPETIQDQHIYEFTYPNKAKGGLFSKTYIRIDKDNILRIRNQMMPAEKLWDDDRDKEEEF